MKIKCRLRSLGLVASILLASVAQATPISGARTGLTTPISTITFSEVSLPNNTALTNQFASFGVSSFSGVFYNGCTQCVTTPPSGAKPDIGNFTRNNTSAFTRAQDISFTSGLDGAAFQFASNGGTFTFTALLNNSVVEQFTANGSRWGYYGFSGINLDEIHISAPSALLIDNLQIGNAVPEPTSIALLGLGLLGFAASRRKSSNNKNA